MLDKLSMNETKFFLLGHKEKRESQMCLNLDQFTTKLFYQGKNKTKLLNNYLCSKHQTLPKIETIYKN